MPSLNWCLVALLLCACNSGQGGGVPDAGPIIIPQQSLGHERIQALDWKPPTVVMQDVDTGRAGWYANQPQLDPGIVTGSSFGRLFKTALPLSPGEQVFAQPLVFGDRLLIATEANNVYVLDAMSGDIVLSHSYGAPWQSSEIGCGDLSPSVGITGTPVIDLTARTAFFFAKSYRDASQSSGRNNVVWYAHGVSIDTLEEQPGFPVEIRGNASNDPTVAFDAFPEMQRPGLLLLDGVVYAGFGGHCDFDQYHGWIVGISEHGDLRTLFATEAGPGSVRGAGIWQSGGGLVSDGPGRIFFSTGNGYSNSIVAPTPGATPPPSLDESVVHLSVQADGTLSAVDFFTPYDVSYLDAADLDFGSGAVVALPDSPFGTSEHPHLALAAGKEGIMYLLDRDALGGFKQGIGGGDATVSQVFVEGGLWSRPAAWSGNGGMAYVVPADGSLQSFQYVMGVDGAPAFTATGHSADPLAYSSGSPIVTSNGTNPASALVWVTYATAPYGPGALRAYDAIPDASGTLALRYEDAFGTHAKFSRPAVGAGRLYVGTADGCVVGYGSPLRGPLFGRAVEFGTIVAKRTAETTASMRARAAVAITSISTTNPAFGVVTTTPKLPAQLGAGDTLTLTTSFVPQAAQPYVGALEIHTDAGLTSLSVHGQGQSSGPALSVSAKGLSFGGVPVNGSRSTNLLVKNVGSQPLTLSGIVAPKAPFSLTGASETHAPLSAGQSLALSLTFAPTDTGTFGGSLSLVSNGGSATVMVSGTSSYSGQLDIEPSSIDFGAIAVGQAPSTTFTIRNVGSADVTIAKSKPPSLGTFAAVGSLDEGTVIKAGALVTEVVTFTPKTVGSFADQWIIGGSDGGGSRTVSFTGTGNGAPDAN